MRTQTEEKVKGAGSSVCHVRHEVIALLRGLLGLDSSGILQQHGVILVCFATDETVEVVKAHSCRPAVERPGHAALSVRRIADEHGGLIAVGSSNLSRLALETGIEWNLPSSSRETVGAHAGLASEFSNLWHDASEQKHIDRNLR